MLLALLISVSVSATPYLDEARGLVERLQFDAALKKLELAGASTTLSLEERREVAALRAHCWAAEGRMEQVDSVYAELLARDSRAPAPSSGPPRLREAFRKAKERLYPPGFVSLTRAASPPGRVVIRLVDPWARCASVEVSASDTAGGWRSTPIELDLEGQGAAATPATGAWFIEARTAEGASCASLGTQAAPFVVESAAPSNVVTASGRASWVPWVVTAVAIALTASAAVTGALGASALDRSRSASFAFDVRAEELAARNAFSWMWGLGASAAASIAASVIFFAAW